MGSRLGVTKIAAGRIGIPLGEYQAKIADGLKWCYHCQTWKQRSQFNIDRTRGDGLSAACIDCRRVAVRKKRKDKAPSVKIRNQATNAVRYEIGHRRMVKPTELPCRDCGKPATEYHHHLGYNRSHWLDVTPLCKSCHVKRHWE